MGPKISALLLVFLSTGVLADSANIARCVDENGDLTYSDFYCTTYENGNPLLMTEQSINRPIRLDSLRARQQRDSGDIKTVEKVNAGTIPSLRLESVTNDAISRCNQRFKHYFRRNHPHVSQVPSVAFNQITDQFVKGPSISISVAATVQYDVQSSTASSYIECTVQKLSENADWVIGFLER